jgi:nucleoside-diphosphate-sugar epimerase
MFSVFNQQTGIPCASLRFGNVIGTRQNPKNGTIVPTWIEKFIAGEPLQIYGDGTQLRDYVRVTDVCRCIMASIDKKLNGVHNVSTGTLLSVNDIRSIFTDITNNRCMFEHIPSKQGDKASVILPPDPKLPECSDKLYRLTIYDALCWRMTRHKDFHWYNPIIIET